MLGTVLVVDVNMLLLRSSQGIILSMFVFEGVLLGQHWWLQKSYRKTAMMKYFNIWLRGLLSYCVYR
jgi:hypothetical protein